MLKKDNWLTGSSSLDCTFWCLVDLIFGFHWWILHRLSVDCVCIYGYQECLLITEGDACEQLWILQLQVAMKTLWRYSVFPATTARFQWSSWNLLSQSGYQTVYLITQDPVHLTKQQNPLSCDNTIPESTPSDRTIENPQVLLATQGFDLQENKGIEYHWW